MEFAWIKTIADRAKQASPLTRQQILILPLLHTTELCASRPVYPETAVTLALSRDRRHLQTYKLGETAETYPPEGNLLFGVNKNEEAPAQQTTAKTNSNAER